MAKVDSPKKYVVIRQVAERWMAGGGHKNEMWAAYETDRPSGMVLFANPLYIPEDA